MSAQNFMNNFSLVMKSALCWLVVSLLTTGGRLAALEVDFATPAPPDELVLAAPKFRPVIYVETGDDPAVMRAANDLAADFARVTGSRPKLKHPIFSGGKIRVIIGTLGNGQTIDRLATAGKLATNGISGQWESFALQVVKIRCPASRRRWSSPAATGAGRFTAFISCRK